MKNLHKHLLELATLAATLSLALPSTALAGSSSPTAGVHIDPASPVAKEYALPLATARGAPADTGSTGSLFGSGITKNRTRTSEPTSTPVASKPVVTTQAEQPPTPAAAEQPTTSAPPVTTTATATQTTTVVTTRTTAAALAHKRRPPSPPRRIRPPIPQQSGPTVRGPAASAKPVAPAPARILEPDSGSGWLWMLVGAMLVLLLGAGGALLAVRTRHRGIDPRPN